MSRHRNVRSMNYSEEYEGFDDVYGHSVEDDCISPSEAGFLYDRTRYPQMSAFINEDNYIAEEEEQNSEEPKKIGKSDLSDVEMEKLRFCVDEIQNVIGEMVPLTTIEEVAIECNFDFKIALDQILNKAELKESSVIAPEEKSEENTRKTGNKDRGGGDGPQQSSQKFVIPRLKRVEVECIERGFNDLNIFEGTSDSCFSSLKKLMDQHKKGTDLEESPIVFESSAAQNNSPSTLAELSECFLSSQNSSESQFQTPDDAKTGFIIPKFQNKKSESPVNWIIDLSSALKSDGEAPTKELSNGGKVNDNDFLVLPAFVEDLCPPPSQVDETRVLNVKVDLYNGKSSPFGKILCRKWKGRVLVIEKPRKVLPPRVVPFDFTTPSPDDILLKHLRRK